MDHKAAVAPRAKPAPTVLPVTAAKVALTPVSAVGCADSGDSGDFGT